MNDDAVSGPTSTRRALLAVNRHARSGEHGYDVIAARLTALGFAVTDAGDANSDRLRELAAGADVVVIGGGDGTLNAAAEHLVAAGKPLGVVPLGTANDFARTLNIPTDIPSACQVIAGAHTRRVDLGRVNGKCFFNVASLGLSVRVTAGLSKERKARFGVFAYLIAAVEAVWHWRPFLADITVDGQTYRVKTVQVAVGNGRHFGGGLTIAADAAIDDGWLDVVSLEVRGWWQLVPLLPALLSGRLAGSDRVRTLRGRTVEVVTRRPRTVNTDGELTTRTPARFEVLPGAIEVFAPPHPAPVPQPAVAPELPNPRPVRRLLAWVGRHDLFTLAAALALVGGVLSFFLLANLAHRNAAGFDESILQAMRTPDDPTRPVGPAWLAGAVRDVTALGGYTVLTLLTVGVVGFLGLRRRWGAAGLLLAAAVGGMLATDWLKGVYARPRPAVVPHLTEVSNASFPSGHSSMAAVVYLTLGVMLARTVARPVLRAYLLGWAMLLTLLVGVSRVYLGVHYPTDVLAGWALDLSWAVLCGLAARTLRRRRKHPPTSPSTPTAVRTP